MATVNAFSDIAAIARFYTNDEIQVYDAGSSSYGCDGACPTYTAGDWYRFKFVIDMTGTPDTYDVLYENCDSPGLTQIATGFELRSAVRPLDHFVAWNNGPSGTVSVNTANGSWSEACTPTTCVAEGYECGLPPDGCGDELDCTSPGCSGGEVCDSNFSCCTQDLDPCNNLYAPSKDCGFWPDNCGVSIDCGDTDCGDGAGGDVCNDGVCCTSLTQTQVCVTTPEPDYECGDWDDGCGGTVNCGSCTGGEACRHRHRPVRNIYKAHAIQHWAKQSWHFVCCQQPARSHHAKRGDL